MSRHKTLAPLGLALLGLTSACGPAASTQESPDSSLSPHDSGPPSAAASIDAASGFHDDASVDDATVNEQDAADHAPTHAIPEAGPVEDDLPVGPNVFPMVAPSLCTTQLGRMFECHYGKGHIDAPSIPKTGELKTRVRGHVKGDCSTQFPILARLSAEGVAPFNYNIFENDEVWLRRDDSAAIASVTIEDVSAFAGKANYDARCRVWLELELNLPIQPSSSAM